MYVSNLRRKLPERKDGHPWFKTLRSRLSDGFRLHDRKFNRAIFAIFDAGAGANVTRCCLARSSRQMTELPDSEQRQGLMIEQHVEAELANDPPTT